MSAHDPAPRAVVLPPDLGLLCTLFAPDPRRAALEAELAAAVAAERGAGGAVTFDAGESGECAAATAARLVRAGVVRAEVHGAPCDAVAADVLAAALSAAGIEVAGPLLRAAPVLAPATAFRWLGDSGLAAPPEALERALAAAVAARGSAAVRLLPRCSGEPGAFVRDGAAWGWRYGFDDAAARTFLAGAVERSLPRHRAELEYALILFQMAVDPLEEMYAGNGIADRNRELLVNIVP